MATAAVTPSAAEVATEAEPAVAVEVQPSGKRQAAAAPVEAEVLPTAETYGARLLEVATAFLPMGFIAFGGPQAHIGLFLKRFVQGKSKWLDEQRFMELMSLGQAMPGPTSTQMATAMGISRAGVLGGLISFWLFDWVGFGVQLGVGSAIHAFEKRASTEGLDTYKMVMLGMGPAAISQVFTAAHALGTKVCGDDAVKISLALITAVVALLVENALVSAFWRGRSSLGGAKVGDDASGGDSSSSGQPMSKQAVIRVRAHTSALPPAPARRDADRLRKELARQRGVSHADALSPAPRPSSPDPRAPRSSLRAARHRLARPARRV
jgi:chromate transport protein ChrA